jgi:hypothetical protein
MASATCSRPMNCFGSTKPRILPLSIKPTSLGRCCLLSLVKNMHINVYGYTYEICKKKLVHIHVCMCIQPLTFDSDRERIPSQKHFSLVSWEQSASALYHCHPSPCRLDTCMYVCMHACVYIYIYIYVYTHICLYVYWSNLPLHLCPCHPIGLAV